MFRQDKYGRNQFPENSNTVFFSFEREIAGSRKINYQHLKIDFGPVPGPNGWVDAPAQKTWKMVPKPVFIGKIHTKFAKNQPKS